ncbi:MAG: hypothetical protein ACE5MM_06640 [Nitrospiraceae bacterium]
MQHENHWEEGPPSSEIDRSAESSSGSSVAPGSSRQNAQAPVVRRLGDLLIDEGNITPDQLSQGLAEQKRTPERLGSVLVRLGFITEDQLVQSLARQYGIPTIDLSRKTLDPEVLKLIPPHIARKYEVLPLKSTKRSLMLAMADPTDISMLDDVAFLTGLRVMSVLASPSAIRQALEQAYSSQPQPLAEPHIARAEAIASGERGVSMRGSSASEAAARWLERETAAQWLEEGRHQLEALRTILNDYDRVRNLSESAERECERLSGFGDENERLKSNLETTERECKQLREEVRQLRAESEHHSKEREALAESLSQFMNEIVTRLRPEQP